MTPPTLQDSVASILASLSSLDSLRFHTSPRRVAAAVLHPPEAFEGGWIRDAEEYERGLFSSSAAHGSVQVGENSEAVHVPAAGSIAREPVIDKNRLRKSILSRSTAGYRQYNERNAAWALQKRRGPERIAGPPTATPLRKRRPTAQKGLGNDADDPEAYLLAARKLLEH